MNKVKHDIERDILLGKLNDATSLKHYGVGWDEDPPGIGSGRYPHGSGKNPYQHGSLPTLEDIERLQKTINPKTHKYYTDAEVAEQLGVIGRSGQPSSATLRSYKSILKSKRDDELYAKVIELKNEGLSGQKIAEKLGFKSESSIRNILNEDARVRKNQALTTAEYIKSYVDKNGMYDVGKGMETVLNVTRTKLNEALDYLSLQGYPIYGGGIQQVTNKGKQTNQLVICPPGTEHKEIYNFEKIHSFLDEDVDTKLTDNGTNIRKKFEYPASLDSSRVGVRYAEEGGINKDGVVEIRRGMEDCNIGDNHYSQVRILVDGTHYIKGMAIYSDDLPDGVDVLFNTNKHQGTPLLSNDPKAKTVLKPIGKDPTNPFGALIKEDGGQTYYDDPKGKFVDKETGKRQSLNVVNIKSAEGDWQEWKDTLPSQFLAKQPLPLAKRQLKIAADDKVNEMKDYLELTNPTVKRNLLMSFADTCDSAAVELKAAALPRQKYQVILPLTSIKDNEVFAPNYQNGEQVALIRYPHAGQFEIPILTVNNKNKEGIKYIGKDSKDAVGISSAVAGRLSGADFDGDTVMVIPTNNGTTNIKNRPPLEGLKDFEPKEMYPEREGMKYMHATQTEMGKISNLITDMTIQGANDEDLAKAVRHSMVVIDAEKHKLDYKRSEIDNDINELKKRYQLKENGHYGGASTILSAAKGKQVVDKREGSRIIDPETGEVTWKTARDSKLYYKVVKKNAAYKALTGTPEFKALSPEEQKKRINQAITDGVITMETKKRTQDSTRMAETLDAYTLVSTYNAPVERAYADYANQMKALANTARREALAAGKIEYSRHAAAEYAPEVSDLMRQLNIAKKQAVKERTAQRLANIDVNAHKEAMISAGATSDEVKKEMKKYEQRAISEARAKAGAKRVNIEISDRQWEAIQAGAISDTQLQQILRHTDTDKIKELATPRRNTELAPWKISKIASMNAMGYTNEEIARSIGVSPSTVSKYL